MSFETHDGLAPAAEAASPTPIRLVEEAHLEAMLADPRVAALAEAAEFKAQAGRLLMLHRPDGTLEAVLVGAGKGGDAMLARGLPSRLPPGDYALEGGGPLAALAWAMGSRVFDRYKSDLRAKAGRRPRLAVAEGLEAVRAKAHALSLARDMVDTPANDMGPRQVESIAREIAERFGAAFSVTEGEALEAGYPAVAAVGRAAGPGREPRMVEIGWGDPAHPVVAVVGKGVVFDTGGLDLKPSSGMRLMKKDMGGAAHALALARMVMAAGLKLRLVVLIPVVENAVGGDAMRPGDVLQTRKGLTVEVGNTDAEGRLILADALQRAAELEPVLTLDFATLTGAARAALGPELPPLFTDDEPLACELLAASLSEQDPMWRMPLWPGYQAALDSEVADLANDPAGWAQAGAVTAALFLKRFAPETGAWAHFDVFAWNARGQPGKPVGAEVYALRACFKVLEDRYGG